MEGQWIGAITGAKFNAHVRANADAVDAHFEGIIYLSPDDSALPTICCQFKTADRAPSFTLTKQWINVIDPETGLLATTERIAQLYPSAKLPAQVELMISWTGDRMEVTWTASDGTTGKFSLNRDTPGALSEVITISGVSDWESFKRHLATLKGKRYLYRGQSEPWPLRTTFHRGGRANLFRYLANDIKVLHRHLCAQTKHMFNLAIPDENGAFLNLLQHHGYPTPLLDWTSSPYVAAFFAFRQVSKNISALTGRKVRLFIFDELAWSSHYPQFPRVEDRRPHLSRLEFLAIDNQRMIPQQAASTVSNVDNIESYIRDIETRMGTIYLRAVDLPASEREAVMRDLGYMGITAGSMFPGIDGTCEQFKERFF